MDEKMGVFFLNKFILKVLTGTILMAVIFFCHNADADAAQITKMLDENRKLMPPGIVASLTILMPEFKKGTTVILNERGEVLEGTLTDSVRFYCVPLKYEVDGIRYLKSCSYEFKADTKVTINDKGEVVKGTLGHNRGEWIWVPLSDNSSLEVPPLTEVSFHPNGILATGTLGTHFNTYLRPVGWIRLLTKDLTDSKSGFVEFKAGTAIELNDKGEVTKGTLNLDAKLLSPSGNIQVYEAGSTVEFDDKGVVVKASKGSVP